MAAFNYTAKRGLSLFGDEVGAWMADTTAETLVGGGSPQTEVPDLSTANNPLVVNGSIVKSAVATGAGLMGYNSFSASNYLEQPYNSDLDFGTGDFCYMEWLRTSGGVASEFVMERSGVGTDVNKYVDSTEQLLVRILTTVIATYQLEVDKWAHVALTRLSGIAYVAINGVLFSQAANTANLPTSGPLVYGARADHTLPGLNVEIALARSNGGMTLAQIKSIYDSEKHLFKKYSTYTQEGQSYSFNLKTTAKNRSTTTVKNDAVTLSGKAQSVVHRDNNEWNISTTLMDRTVADTQIRLSEFREFLYSTRGSEQFTFDPYGSVASEDEPVTAIRLGATVNEAEEPFLDKFRASIKLREVE